MLPPRWTAKTGKGKSGASIINYTKEEMIEGQRKKSESRLTSYKVLLNVQGFVDTKGFSQAPFRL